MEMKSTNTGLSLLSTANLKKNYKQKNNADVKALDDVSIDFGQKGLIFLLGKSGSGKSTMLNTIGGLDRFDSGDITIKGKSSKSFSAAEWDSYRNTYVGFIFQDYSIIESYTIQKNIGLALELQGTKKREIPKRVEELLAKVELTGFAKRKPNELSGGQKQRVAIARALVKNPEIILADEPTGALDSKTSAQVFDILRNLADEKLVIVVSHDKDAAYRYGDRVITMADGKVLTDELNDGGTKYIGDTVDSYRTDGMVTRAIRIPANQELTADIAPELNEIMEREDSQLYIPIPKGAKIDKNTISQINRLLSENGTNEQYLAVVRNIETIQGTTDVAFKDRKNPSTLKDKALSPFKLIKSRLPLKNSWKMAGGNIKRKTIRTIFTGLLLAVSLSVFGIVLTLSSFNLANSLKDSYAQQYSETGKAEMFTANLKGQFNYNYNGMISDEVAGKMVEIGKLGVQNGMVVAPRFTGYTNNDSKFGIIDMDYRDIDSSFNITVGKMPSNKIDAQRLEAAIFDFDCNAACESAIAVGAWYFPQHNSQDSWNWNLLAARRSATTFADKYQDIKVTGIIDTGYKNMTSDDDKAKLKWMSENYFGNLVAPDFSLHHDFIGTAETFINVEGNYGNIQPLTRTGSAFKGSALSVDLADDEVSLNADYHAFTNLQMFEWDQSENNAWYSMDDAQRNAFLTSKGIIGKEIEMLVNNKKQTLKIKSVFGEVNAKAYATTAMTANNEISALVSDKVWEENYAGNKYLSAAIRLSGVKEYDNKLIDLLVENKINFDGSAVYAGMSMIEAFVRTSATALTIVALIFGGFASFLMFGAIGSSIAARKRDIGTLRAIGARGNDIAGIFIFESVIQAIIASIMGFIGVFLACMGINQMATDTAKISLNIVVPTPIVYGAVLGLAVLIAILAALIPVIRVSKMKPIDAIHNR